MMNMIGYWGEMKMGVYCASRWRRRIVKMKITHIPKDKLIKIRYESEEEKIIALENAKFVAKWSDAEVEGLKQTG